jgi:ubiquinone/menaquinone biosynthesis C-methylase UbiE
MRAELAEAIWRVGGPRLRGDARGNGGPILDMGCGTGGWLATLIDRGVAPDRLHGVDILPARIAAARERMGAADRKGSSVPVNLREADVRQLPFPDHRFDAVLLILVLSSLGHQTDVRRALQEAQRVTRPGGVLVVYEPRHRSPNRYTLHVSPSHVREVLGPVAVHPITVWPPVARRLGPFTSRLYPLLSRRPLATSHALTVRRV